MSMWSLRWHFTNTSVAGAPYSIKGYSYSLSHSQTLWWRVRWLKQCRLEVVVSGQNSGAVWPPEWPKVRNRQGHIVSPPVDRYWLVFVRRYSTVTAFSWFCVFYSEWSRSVQVSLLYSVLPHHGRRSELSGRCFRPDGSLWLPLIRHYIAVTSGRLQRYQQRADNARCHCRSGDSCQHLHLDEGHRLSCPAHSQTGLICSSSVTWVPVAVWQPCCLHCFDAVGWAAGRASSL